MVIWLISVRVSPVSSAPLILAPGTKMQQASSAPTVQQKNPKPQHQVMISTMFCRVKDINPKPTTASAPE